MLRDTKVQSKQSKSFWPRRENYQHNRQYDRRHEIDNADEYYNDARGYSQDYVRNCRRDVGYYDTYSAFWGNQRDFYQHSSDHRTISIDTSCGVNEPQVKTRILSFNCYGIKCSFLSITDWMEKLDIIFVNLSAEPSRG
jgi:hypothetical protein